MKPPARVEVTYPLVQDLLHQQFPVLSRLALGTHALAGTDNAVFRLGEEFAVRVPRVESAATQLAKEATWLPRLAPLLPMPIPEPVALGLPGAEYPWAWGIYRWLPGETPAQHRLADEVGDAERLARFVSALHAADVPGGPPADVGNGFRGGPLRKRGDFTLAMIEMAGHVFDAGALRALWDAALSAGPWRSEGVWIHGDLHPGNLLAQEGKTTAVVDWGAMAIGDPACDLMIVWNFPDEPRRTFRNIIDVDDDTWERGRGWALTQWIAGLLADEPDNEARRVITRLLSDER